MCCSHTGRGRLWGRVRDFIMLKILDMLSKEPVHGYGIMRRLEDEYGFRISPGLLYPILRRIVDMGFAVASESIVGGKKVVVYEITHDGREFLEKNRKDLEFFEKRFRRIKECRFHDLMERLRAIFMNIDRLSDKDFEELKKAVDRFLEDTKGLGT
jgi:DNA-binding PadR family transcriptional regulator